MEHLLRAVIISAAVASVVLGFLAGAVAHLFGFDFWTAFGVSAAIVAAFFVGQIVMAA